MGIVTVSLGRYAARVDMNEAVALAIKAEMLVAKATYRSLARDSRIPERTLARILKPERDIKVDQVAAIADALNRPPHELIERAEQLMAREETPRLIIADDEVDLQSRASQRPD